MIVTMTMAVFLNKTYYFALRYNMPSFSYVDSLDSAITGAAFSLHTPILDTAFNFITLMGNTSTVVFITALFTIWFCLNKKYRSAYLLLLVVTASTLSTHLLKLVFVRPRPDVLLNQLETFSFPSGHATAAIALYGVLAYIFSQLPKKTPRRYVALIVLLLLIVLVGFSRIYLGFHYLSDVIAGYAVGALWLAVSIYLFKNKV